MPFVSPLAIDAAASGTQWLADTGWNRGKHA